MAVERRGGDVIEQPSSQELTNPLVKVWPMNNLPFQNNQLLQAAAAVSTEPQSTSTVYCCSPHYNITRLIRKVSFPGTVYRNKTQLHGNIYCKRYSMCSAFFQHIRHRNWDICHTVGLTSVYCVAEVCRLGLEPLRSGVSCFGTHRAHNFLNNRRSVPISCNKEWEICGKWLLSSVIVKLCSVHSETLSLTALHSRREME
jgi:hypothetical protein